MELNKMLQKLDSYWKQSNVCQLEFTAAQGFIMNEFGPSCVIL